MNGLNISAEPDKEYKFIKLPSFGRGTGQELESRTSKQSKQKYNASVHTKRMQQKSNITLRKSTNEIKNTAIVEAEQNHEPDEV